MKHIIVCILLIAAAFTAQGFISARSCAGQEAAAGGKGPVLGKWAFEGKDDKGVAWKGTLTIRELDTLRFDTGKYHSMCVLEAESKDGSNVVDTPCKWDPGKREVSFSTGTEAAYAATLSADGKSMTHGKWTETEKDYQTGKVIITRTGVWTAEYTGP